MLQPVTAREIRAARQVGNNHAIHTLLRRKLIAPAGRAQTRGKPLQYRTTQRFLIEFGLDDLSELPNVWDSVTSPASYRARIPPDSGGFPAPPPGRMNPCAAVAGKSAYPSAVAAMFASVAKRSDESHLGLTFTWLVNSEQQLDKFRRVTRYPRLQKFIRPAAADTMLNEIRALAELTGPLPKLDVCSDPADNFLLAMAEISRAVTCSLATVGIY